MKTLKSVLAVFLVLCMVCSAAPVYAFEARPATAPETVKPEPAQTESVQPAAEPVRGVHNQIVIDDNSAGGYEGDYVVIYNPALSSSTSYSTGTMTGLIETTVNPSVLGGGTLRGVTDPDKPFYKIDVDAKLAELAKTAEAVEPPEPTRASYNAGDTKSFTLVNVQTSSTYSLQFECLYVGQHCYIWTPTSTTGTYYPLDEIDPTYAELAANEFDSKFDLMQSSFGNHTNGTNGDGKLHILYYNIDEGWNGSGGYIAGFFYQGDISANGLPILNIDTYPGVYYQNPNSGNIYKRMDDTYNTMVHEYQHLINYSNTSGMNSWLNECFSAAAEEICYPGSSVVDRIQSWENYSFYENNDWLDPPKEIAYSPSDCPNLHNGYSMYGWSNDLDDVLALYGQVSLFAQYLFTRFGNTIYQQISTRYAALSTWSSNKEQTAITNATGVSCADLTRDFRVALTANAAQGQGNDIYGFREQDNYDPTQYYNVLNPYSLLSPVIFTGTSCSIKGGGAITVKPVNGVYNPPSGASSSLKYIGVKVIEYTVTAVSNNEAWGTVSVDGTTITASPADGYYVEDYEVIEGTATAVINGNTIAVTPRSDCTIRVIFAPKPTYTVNYVACGTAQGTVSALVNDVIALPSSVSVNPDGWTFSGWIDHQIEETSVMPEFFAPGASYTVTGNATLYAIYTRVEEGSGELSYELVTEAPDDWAGRYVITYLTTTSMYLMKGVTPSSNGAQIEDNKNSAAYAASGVSLSGTTLTNVSDSYLFTLAPHGSYYSIQSVSTGTYLGMDSSSYMAGYTVYTANNCDWEPGTKANCSTATNATNGQYPLISFNSNSGEYYFWSGNPNNTVAPSVRWWKETNGSATYYWTDPVTSQQLVTVYVVDQTNSGTFNAYVYNAGTNTNDGTAWPGHNLSTAANYLGKDFEGNNYYSFEIDLAKYDTVIFNNGAGAQNSDENALHLAGQTGDKFAVYNNTQWQASIGTDIWVGEGEITTQPTCVTQGVRTYTGIVFGIPENKNIGYGDHQPAAEPVVENEVEPTCEEDGGYDNVVYCALCGTEIFRQHVVMDALDHDYGEPSYEWTQTEDGYTCTATAVCNNDASHVLTETVTAELEVTVEPAVGEPGEGVYTAVFEEKIFEPQEKVVELPPKEAELADGYYLIGPDGWELEDIDPHNIFVPNPDNEGEYTLQTTLSVGDQIKVVYVLNDGIKEWYPDGLNNEYTVDEAHSGNVTVYFRDTYNSDWADPFGGYFYIEAVETPLIETSLNLLSAISLNYKVNIDRADAMGLTDLKLILVHTKYVKDSGTYEDETFEITPKTSGEYYYFPSQKIAAAQLNDHMTAHLEGKLNGEDWTSEELTLNPVDIAYNKIALAATPDVQKTMYANLIRYCGTAQVVFEYNTANPAMDDRWTTEVSGWATQAEPTVTNCLDEGDKDGKTVVIDNYNINLGASVDINYNILLPTDGSVNKADLKVVISYTNAKGVVMNLEIKGKTWTKRSGTDYYVATLTGPSSADMCQPITAKIVDKSGNELSNTYVCDVEAFVYNKLANQPEPAYRALLIAMLQFGQSAKAVFAP